MKILLNERHYEEMLQEFSSLAQQNDPANRERLLEMRDALATYESDNHPEPPLPQSLSGRLEVEMYKLRLNQKGFASFIGITETRLSEVMKGKRKPNVDLLKRLRTKLKISGDELLELA